MGLDEDELPGLVTVWRKANPAIVKLWGDVETAAMNAVQEGTEETVGPLTYYVDGRRWLICRLPSGRELAYAQPRIQPDGRFGRMSLTYEGMNQETKRWGRIPTYGGKLVENAVQAIARDCLAETLMRCKDLRTVMHVHDELIIEVRDDLTESTECWVAEAMADPIPWAPGLPLRGDGFTTAFYRKED
jgi:DNA polymerase bacteriophage-type